MKVNSCKQIFCDKRKVSVHHIREENRRFQSVNRVTVAVNRMEPEAMRCGRRTMREQIIWEWVKWEWEDMGGGGNTYMEEDL